VQKKIHGSTAQLLWAKASMTVASSAHNSAFCFAEMVVAENLRQLNLITAMKQRNIFLESAAKNLTDDLSVLKQSQDDFNKTLMTKMCLLLNSKKKEILRLRGLVSGSTSVRAVSGVKRTIDETADTEEEETASDSETVQKRAPKRAKTTSVRAKKSTNLKGIDQLIFCLIREKSYIP
jgi:gas vesicle protein